MFERVTDRGRRVLVLAQEEARLLHHGFIGTEHLLLGLLDEESGLAAQALMSLGVTLESARQKVRERTYSSEAVPVGSQPFTPRAKELLELALREAVQLGHKGIDTEHLLLGLARQGESTAVEVLASLGVTLDQVRQRLLSLMSHPGYVPSDEGTGVDDAPGERGTPDATRVARTVGGYAFGKRARPDPDAAFASPSADDNGSPSMGTAPADMPPTMVRELASRYDHLPVRRIRRDADFWALRRVEKEHIERLARLHQLDDGARDVAVDWWLGEVQRRCAGTSARRERLEQRRLHRIHQHPRFRSNAVFQLYWNTVGPGGRTWFGNRYTTIRRYTFRIHWRP